MKTKLACLAIIAAALLLGHRQSSRIEALESGIGRSETSRVTKVSTSLERKNETGYRSKHHHRDAGVSAPQVYERLLPLMKSPLGGNIMGVDAALQHREAMKEILRLDLNGIRELTALVSQSKELKKTRPMQHIASILCMIAMADADPQAAFSHLMDNKPWNRLFSPDDIGDGTMVNYVLLRMALDDPGKALDSLRVVEECRKKQSDDTERGLVWQISRTDPWLALDHILQQPEARQSQIMQSIGHAMETDDERTAMFRALRDRRDDRPKLMEQAFASLCEDQSNPPDAREWLEKIGMSDDEKIQFHEGITESMATRSQLSLEDARWVADFMPASPERDTMIWNIVKMENPSDGLESVMAFLKEQGIDPEAMIRQQADSD